MIDPELAKLRDEVSILQRSIHRLSATLKIAALPSPADKKQTEGREPISSCPSLF